MRYKLLGLLLLSSQLLAVDYVDVYQKRGMKGLETVMDVALATTEYWDTTLIDKNITYGLFSGFDNLLICNKKKGELKRFTKDGMHQLNKMNDLSTFTGKIDGDKQYEGDLKTPVGVYTFTKKLKYVDQFYGPLALVTNYPNAFDKARSKTGSGIWVHGLPLKGDRDTFTKGCLAIDNKDLVKLDKSINPKTTALIIAPEETRVLKKETLSKLLSTLFKWRNAWKYNKYEQYLSFYDETFKRPNGTNFAQFKAQKKYVFEGSRKKHIDFSQINIIPYPSGNGDRLFFISFFEKYDSGSVHFRGFKKLYVKFVDNSFKILTEN